MRVAAALLCALVLAGVASAEAQAAAPAVPRIDDDIAVFCAASITVPDGTVITATGAYRIAFVVADSFCLNGAIDLYASRAARTGAPRRPRRCPPAPAAGALA